MTTGRGLIYIRVRVSKVNSTQEVDIEFWCKNLDWNILELLLVQVDKENSMEFPLNFLHYLYNYYIVCALSPHSSYVT